LLGRLRVVLSDGFQRRSSFRQIAAKASSA
jgi:hypothetical protein